MLPDVTAALEPFLDAYTVKTVVRATVDFEPTTTVTERVIDAVVRPADKAKLNPDKIDWALQYLKVHQKTSGDPVQIGEFIVVDGADFKIIEQADYGTAGFVAALAEQTKRGAL